MKTIFASNLFQGKVALITGGGTGIGLRTARELAYLGATVILASRTFENVQKGAEIINSEGGKAFPIKCNIRKEKDVKKCIERTIKIAGTLDYLINNAGGQFPSLAEDIKLKGWHAVIETNLTGPFLMSKEAFNQIFKKKGGQIVNIIANMWNGFPRMSHTGSARAGTENLTKSLATEWGRYGVRVNAVAPGMIESSGISTYDMSFQSFFRSGGKFNQTYRLGTEAEVAAAVIFLLSPGASFITGHTIRVDGGESIYSPWYPPVKNNKIPPFND